MNFHTATIGELEDKHERITALLADFQKRGMDRRHELLFSSLRRYEARVWFHLKKRRDTQSDLYPERVYS